MAAACVLSVELKTCLPARMRASKFWTPGEATVTWSDGRIHELALRFLGHGLARDCFSVHPCHGYVLKIEAVCNQIHPYYGSVLRSNELERQLGESPLGQVTPNVLGCVFSQWECQKVSVLVIESLQHDFASLFRELVLLVPEEEVLGAAIALIMRTRIRLLPSDEPSSLGQHLGTLQGAFWHIVSTQEQGNLTVAFGLHA